MPYVVETDAPCRCGDVHGYVTKMCSLAVWIDGPSATWVAGHIEGSRVREIDEVPSGISYTIFAHRNGRPDPSLPRGERALSRG